MKKRDRHQNTVIVEQDEDGCVVGWVLAIPVCHTQAKNIVDPEKGMHEAARLCLGVAREDPEYHRAVEGSACQPGLSGLEMITL